MFIAFPGLTSASIFNHCSNGPVVIMSTVLSFLELPAEIRNQIYSYVAADEGSCQVNPISIDIVIWSGSGLRNYDSKVITLTRNGAKLKHGLAALLRVNKTLREECLAFVLDQNVIIAGHDSSIEDLINALGKPSRHLRRLILPHQPGLTYPLSRGARITALLQNCRSIQAQLPKLERLDISIVTTHAGDKCIVEWARQHRSPTPPSLESRSVVRQCTAAEHISMASNEPLTEDFHMLARSKSVST